MMNILTLLKFCLITNVTELDDYDDDNVDDDNVDDDNVDDDNVDDDNVDDDNGTIVLSIYKNKLSPIIFMMTTSNIHLECNITCFSVFLKV